MSSWLENLEDGRCNLWRLHWSRGSGKSRVTRSKRFSGGKRAALVALREFSDECEAMPLASFRLPGYMRELSAERLAAGLISENTCAQYIWAARVFDVVLDVPLSSVSTADVRGALARIRAGDTPSERPLSDKSINNLIKCGRAVFDEAMRANLAPSNPFRGVVVAPAKKERRSLAPVAAAQLLDRLPYDNAGAFAASLILRSGLRASEALGLVWGDLSGGLNVRRGITKTSAGVRFVPLSDDDLEFIDARRQFLECVHKRAGGVLELSDRLCCGNDGRPLTYNALRLWWARHREGLGCDLTLHELRHTYLTNLAQAGVHPAVMQRLAGHSSARVSLEIYTHINNSDLVSAVGALSSIRNN